MSENENQSAAQPPAVQEKVSLWSLFWIFAKIGAMTFGGGYAMLPIITRELCENRDWLTEDEIMDYFAIGQCTPGVIAVNTATFTGRKMRGIAGGIVASLGIVFPSIVIITTIASLLRNFAHLQPVQDALAGIRVCVCILILNAVIKLWKSAVVDIPALIMFIVIFLASVFFDISPIIMVVAAGVCGILLKGRKQEQAAIEAASDAVYEGKTDVPVGKSANSASAEGAAAQNSPDGKEAR